MNPLTRLILLAALVVPCVGCREEKKPPANPNPAPVPPASDMFDKGKAPGANTGQKAS